MQADRLTNRLTRGCPGQNTTGTAKKGKLEHNNYYNVIMQQLFELTKEKNNGTNRLVSVNNLRAPYTDLLCKQYVMSGIEQKRKITIKVIAT